MGIAEVAPNESIDSALRRFKLPKRDTPLDAPKLDWQAAHARGRVLMAAESAAWHQNRLQKQNTTQKQSKHEAVETAAAIMPTSL